MLHVRLTTLIVGAGKKLKGQGGGEVTGEVGTG